MPWYTPHVAPSYIPDDPNFVFAWHINRAAVYQNTNIRIDLDINVQEVWPDYSGFGVKVGIYDNYVFPEHEDLAVNYDSSLHAKLANGQTLVPGGTGVDAHGTAVAGIIAAADNNVGSIGVAYNATIAAVPINGPSSPNSDADNKAILEHMVNFDVANHSWGFYTAFEGQRLRSTANGPSALEIIGDGVEYAAENGRGGLGTIVVSASGNERVWRSETFNGQTRWYPPGDVNTNAPVGAQRQAIAVAAVAQDGYVAEYSSPGANLLVSAPSSEDMNATNGLTTTKYLFGNDYMIFGGTSAAAPVVSGVVALILDANPNLGWRDVKEILALSARHVGSLDGQPANTVEGEFDAWDFNGAKNWNGGGMHFSHDYGFGLVDAHAAVRLAETWGTKAQTSANEVSVTKTVHEATPILIPNAGDPTGPGPITRTFQVTEKIDLETITLDLDFYHPFISLLEVTLTSPSGTVSTLLRSGTGDGAVEDWTFSSNAFMGEESVGTWTLTVVDKNGGYGGGPGFRWAEFSGADLNLHGSPDSNDDTYYFTNEFAYLPYSEHFFVGGDMNGGHDTINAAAVTYDTTIDLQNGTFKMADRVGGFSFGGTEPASFYMIEDIITGDGGDTVTGNAANNVIRGMRGHDHLIGMDGDDNLDGGAGVDTLEGGKGNDTLVVDRETLQFATNFLDGGDDSDTLSFFRFIRGSVTVDLATGAFGSTRFVNVENINATRFSDKLYGDAKENKLDGRGGADIMEGRGGGDTYYVDNTGDVVTEAANAGTDKVFASITHALSANVENLELTGTANIDGTGNGSVNLIIGNAGHNTLQGNGGNDIMRGGAGNDTYSVSSAGDTVVESANQGADTVRSTVSYALTANVEKLILTGSANINGTGNTLANEITGNGAINILKGGGSSDIMRGGLGTDQYYGQEGNDSFVFASAAEAGVGANRDVIRGFEAFGDNDTIDLSGFGGTLTYSTATSFSGAVNEVIRVQSGDDVLIRINTDGDLAAEAEILLTNTLKSAVTSSDFDLV